MGGRGLFLFTDLYNNGSIIIDFYSPTYIIMAEYKKVLIPPYPCTVMVEMSDLPAEPGEILEVVVKSTKERQEHFYVTVEWKGAIGTFRFSKPKKE